MEGLNHFYWQSGRYPQAEAAYQAAAAVVSSAARGAKDTDKATCLRVQVRALAYQSNFQRVSGKRDAARRIQQQCLAILEDPALAGVDTRLEHAILSSIMARTVCMADYVQGRQRFEESFYLFRDLVLQREMAGTLTSWGTMSMFLGAYQDAQQRLEEGLAISRALGNLSGVSVCLHRLAQIAWLQGRFEEAELLARQGYATSLEASSLTGSAVSLLEVVTASVIDETKVPRRTASVVGGILIALLGLLPALSLDFLGVMDRLAEALLALGAFFMSIFVGWVAVGAADELRKGASEKFHRLVPSLMATIRWVLPPVILFAAVYAFMAVWREYMAAYGG